MKKTVQYFPFIFIICLSISCKKTPNTPPNSTTNTVATPYADLVATKGYMYYNGNGFLPVDMSAYATFQTNAQNSSSLIQINNVWANGTKLKFDPTSKIYSDTTGIIHVIPTTWVVAGASSIPSFTFTNNDSLPSYTGGALLPDTITKSQGITIQVNGVSNANFIDVNFYNVQTAVSVHHTYALQAQTNNTIVFSASELSALPANATNPGTTYLNINIFRDNTQAISNTTINFRNQLELTKEVYVK